VAGESVSMQTESKGKQSLRSCLLLRPRLELGPMGGDPEDCVLQPLEKDKRIHDYILNN